MEIEQRAASSQLVDGLGKRVTITEISRWDDLDVRRAESSSSFSSSSRTPARMMLSVATGVARPAALRQRGPARPARTATGIPARMPLKDVSGVLKSPWASTQTTPTLCPRRQPVPVRKLPQSRPYHRPRARGRHPRFGVPRRPNGHIRTRRPMFSAVRPSSRSAGSRCASWGPARLMPAARNCSGNPAVSSASGPAPSPSPRSSYR